MFSHVMVGSSDLDRSKVFYDALLGILGAKPGHIQNARVVYQTPTGVFVAAQPINGKPMTFANGGTIGFACTTPQQVEAWHAAGVANGGVSCEDPPGVRDMGDTQLYLAYLRDPDGNKLCGLHYLP